MRQAQIGPETVFGFTHGIVTEVHPEEGWLQFRQIEAEALEDESYGRTLTRSQTASELFIGGIEHFFPVDGVEINEVVCYDLKNIAPGRLVTCFETMVVLSIPFVDEDGEFTGGQHFSYGREVWLGGKACDTKYVAEFLEEKALETLDNK